MPNNHDGENLFSAPPFAQQGQPVAVTARAREYPHLPGQHRIEALSCSLFACGDMGLEMHCSCGASGGTVISNGGCGPGTHKQRGAPDLDPLHLDLVSLATSTEFSIARHGGLVSAS